MQETADQFEGSPLHRTGKILEVLGLGPTELVLIGVAASIAGGVTVVAGPRYGLAVGALSVAGYLAGRIQRKGFER